MAFEIKATGTQYIDPNDRLIGFNEYCRAEFLTISDEGCVIRCALRPEFLNPQGIAHGGLIATMMDIAAGTMALQIDRIQHNIVTQNCDIHFLRPGTGSAIRAVSTVLRKGKKVCVVRSECYAEDSRKLIADSIYEVMYLDEPFPAASRHSQS